MTSTSYFLHTLSFPWIPATAMVPSMERVHGTGPLEPFFTSIHDFISTLLDVVSHTCIKSPVGLDKLFTCYSIFQFSRFLRIILFKLPITLFILIILPQSGQNDHHILHLYTLAKQLSLKEHIQWWERI